MKINNTTIICMLAVTTAIGFNACKKDSATSSDTATEQAAVSTSTSGIASEMMYDDAFDVVTQAGEQNNLTVNSTNTQVINSLAENSTFTGTAITGATITLSPQDPSVFPKTMTIDYGTGVTSANGITRKGQIIVNLSGKIRVAGSSISVTFNNYSINSYKLTGTYTLTPKVAANAGVNYIATITDGSITLPNGQVSTYSGTETFTQTAGIGTSSITDDTYEITGTFSYSNTSNGSISATITNPLVKSADCKDITSGTVAFVYKGLSGTLDFGSGTCDNIATIKVGKTTNTITLAR